MFDLPNLFFMKKQVKLKARETVATNHDFYNLFRPIAPSIDIIGKVAQIISALTEAITIWHITQSEMVGASKATAIVVSIIATLLVVAILELGGRKFLQVLTRALVWKRLKNAWYISLFSIVAFITIGIGVLSFRLSTNGIHHAFVSNVPVVSSFDDSELKKEFRSTTLELSDHFDKELQLIKDNHKEGMLSVVAKYDAQINDGQIKVKQYDRSYAKGAKWAKGHADKYRKKVSQLEIARADAKIALQETYTKKVEKWQSRKNKARASAKAELNKKVAANEKIEEKVHQSKSNKASFWGSLFSFLVGFSVILAFICIITVEVYRRGSGIEVAYDEEDKDPSILEIFWFGLTNRMDGFFRRRAEKFAQISSPGTPNRSSIGFDYPKPMVSGYSSGDMPSTEMDDMDIH